MGAYLVPAAAALAVGLAQFPDPYCQAVSKGLGVFALLMVNPGALGSVLGAPLKSFVTPQETPHALMTTQPAAGPATGEGDAHD